MSADTLTQCLARRYALALGLLTVLFAFRVIAQLVQFWYPVDFLPAFNRWHSEVLPYHWLVVTQVMILWMCLGVIWRLMNNRVIPSSRKGHLLSVLGLIYFGGMCIRLLVGATVAKEHDWFGAALPTVFHLVLASFVILFGRFHTLGTQALPVTQKGELI